MKGADLYAGGNFTTAGGVSANHVAKWNGSRWEALGSGTDGIVLALAVIGGNLYAGGDFAHAGGNDADSLARWNGSSWSSVGSGLSPNDWGGPWVETLAVSGSDLYVGGFFAVAGGTNVAKVNGSAWQRLGNGVDNPPSPVRALAPAVATEER